MIWALSSDGLIQCIFELSERIGDSGADLWSITDLFVSLDSTVRLAHEFWTSVGFFGTGQIAASLQVSKLTPFVNNGEYPSLFYETSRSIPQTAARPTYGNYPISQAGAKLSMKYEDRTSLRRRSLVRVGNQLLRDLRFRVDTQAVESALNTFSWLV